MAESTTQSHPPLRIGLVGLGTVGGAVARVLCSGAYPGVRLVRVCTRPGGRPRPEWLPADVESTTSFDALLSADIDAVVELVGGVSPAHRWLARALEAGKPVVTANKQLIAEHGPSLAGLAERKRCLLRFGASVAGGVPVIDAIREGLSGDRLTRIAGVLNGTCNYILTRMEEAGASFAAALGEAQSKGYAEADPTADVEGFDARAKLAILCQVGLGQALATSAIACTSIAGITPADFARADAQGATIRQVSRVERCAPDPAAGGAGPGPTAPGVLKASVGPELVPHGSILAGLRGCENAVILTGERGGDTILAGRGAGGDATAVAVISDILAIARAHRRPSGAA